MAHALSAHSSISPDGIYRYIPPTLAVHQDFTLLLAVFQGFPLLCRYRGYSILLGEYFTRIYAVFPRSMLWIYSLSILAVFGPQ